MNTYIEFAKIFVATIFFWLVVVGICVLIKTILTKNGSVRKTNVGKCPYCYTNYSIMNHSITSYECKICRYELPRPK